MLVSSFTVSAQTRSTGGPRQTNHYLMGATQSSAGAWETYSVRGVDLSAGGYWWSIAGVDSVAGLSRWDYSMPGTFKASDPEITIHWADTATQGVVQLRQGDSERAKPVDELTVALKAAAAGPCEYYVKGDEVSSAPHSYPGYWYPYTGRDQTFAVCPNTWYALGISRQCTQQRWTVTYYTENGRQYVERWIDRSGYPQRTPEICYVRWYSTVPCGGSVYPYDNSTQQPGYKGDYGSFLPQACGSAPAGERIVSAKIDSESWGLAQWSQGCGDDHKSALVWVYYAVQPIQNLTLNVGSSVCQGQSVTATVNASANATGYEWQVLVSGQPTICTQRIRVCVTCPLDPAEPVCCDGDRSVSTTPGTAVSTASAARISVSPNPATGADEVAVIADVTQRLRSVELYDLQGRVIQRVTTKQSDQAALKLSLRDVPAGVYLLRADDGEQVSTTRLVRE